jgi:large subunit ribosomal protein L33
MRDIIRLVCTGTAGQPCARKSVYCTTKNKKTMTKKLELKKYCKYCKTHCTHKEGK